MDSHLEAIVGVGTLTVGGLADHELEELGRHAHGTVDNKVLGKGLVLQVGADLLYGLAVLGGKGDADTVNLGSLLDLDLLLYCVRCVCVCVCVCVVTVIGVI